jgi:hypothetical protein
MSTYKYPKEINIDDLSNLAEHAKKIKRKATISLLSTTMIYGIVAMLLGPFFLFLTEYLPRSFPNMPQEELFISILLLFALVLELLLLFLFNFIELGINRLLKLKYRESVLAECILIASFLVKGERRRAISEVDMLITSAWILRRTSGRMYAEEISLLSNGKRQIKRMLLFSEEKIPQIFYGFGLTLVNNDDPMAYRFLKQILKEANKYGKLAGTLETIEDTLKSVKGIIALISSIVVIIATLWGIFG